MTAATTRQGVSRSAARRLQRRRQREQQRCRGTDGKREQNQPHVDGHFGDARQLRRRGAQRGKAPACEQQAAQRTDQGEQQPFADQLGDDAPTVGTESEADGHLVLAPGGIREQQAGDVAAGRQQDETDRAEDEP